MLTVAAFTGWTRPEMNAVDSQAILPHVNIATTLGFHVFASNSKAKAGLDGSEDVQSQGMMNQGLVAQSVRAADS